MMTLENALTQETRMWEAAKNRDTERFLGIVSPEAVMVCGGYRYTGKEYAEIISNFDCKAFAIDDFEIIHESDNAFQVHYVLKMEVEDARNRDLEGTFHITTTWSFENGSWKAVFNMDHRIV